MLTPEPVTRTGGEACGTDCRQITFGPYVSLRYEVQGDLLVYSEESMGTEEKVYMVDLARDEEWLIRRPHFRDRPGCFWVSTDGKRLAYDCLISPAPGQYTDALQLYDPATHEERDLECLPLVVDKSSAAQYVTLGSTGVAMQGSTTSIGPEAWFHRFSDGAFVKLSTVAAYFTHMSGSRLVWTEVVKVQDKNVTQILLQDTATGTHAVIDPQPWSRWLPRIDGDRVVWVDHGAAPGNMYSQGNSDIYLHDLGSGKTTPVVTNPARQDFPDAGC